MEKRIIPISRELAEKEPCGIVGRCADFILAASPLIRTKRKTQHIVLSFSSAGMQSKSEPFPFDAAFAASPKVTVCVPSL